MEKSGAPAEHITQLTADYLSNRAYFAAQAMTYHQFEKALYERKLITPNQPLTVKELDDAWVKASRKFYGSHVNMRDESFQRGWIQEYPRDYILDKTAFYNYSYPLAVAVSDALYAKSHTMDAAQFSERYQAMLAQGQQHSLQELLKTHFEIDISKPDILEHSAEQAKTMIDGLPLPAEKKTQWQDRVPPQQATTPVKYTPNSPSPSTQTWLMRVAESTAANRTR